MCIGLSLISTYAESSFASISNLKSLLGSFGPFILSDSFGIEALLPRRLKGIIAERSSSVLGFLTLISGTLKLFSNMEFCSAAALRPG